MKMELDIPIHENDWTLCGEYRNHKEFENLNTDKMQQGRPGSDFILYTPGVFVCFFWRPSWFLNSKKNACEKYSQAFLNFPEGLFYNHFPTYFLCSNAQGIEIYSFAHISSIKFYAMLTGFCINTRFGI